MCVDRNKVYNFGNKYLFYGALQSLRQDVSDARLFRIKELEETAVKENPQSPSPKKIDRSRLKT
jgi:hypothetical protein